MELVIRDSEAIIPIRPIPPKDIEKVNQWHEELFGQTGLERALFIGEHLLWWKDLIPHGKWENWRSQTFPKISRSCAQQYMLLGKHREQILQSNSNAYDHGHLTICDATELVRKKKPNSKTKPRKNRISKTVLERLLALWEKLDPRDRETFLKKVSV